jgi:hypothetical protein
METYENLGEIAEKEKNGGGAVNKANPYFGNSLDFLCGHKAQAD